MICILVLRFSQTLKHVLQCTVLSNALKCVISDKPPTGAHLEALKEQQPLLLPSPVLSLLQLAWPLAPTTT